MILKVYCDQPSFRTVIFSSGFNVILAERTKESTKKDSRNGLGKTTLLEIINFCLGGRASKNKGLLVKSLLDWTFSLEIEIQSQTYTVHRNTKKPGHVAIKGEFSDWPTMPEKDDETGEYILSIKDWNAVLGDLMFGLKIKNSDEKYKPTFRSLISYFIRKGRDAYSTPFEHHRKQLEWDKQVNNSYLLGLGWKYAQRWQILKDQEKILLKLKEAATSGIVAELVGSIGELETEKVRSEEIVKNQGQQLKTFKVHSQYQQIEERTNILTTEIHNLSNSNVSDKRLVEFYENSLKEEIPASGDLIIKLYEEAKVLMPKSVIKHLQDVQDFHKKIIINRRNFLEAEIRRIKENIEKKRERIHIISEERASLMSILETHKALEEYTKLQQLHMESISKLEEIKRRIENLKKFEQGKSALRIDFEQLQVEARSDYEERASIREKAISLFNSNSQALYEAPGKLIIDIGPTGFKFNVDIERSASQGIESMKVFCFDLMLAQLWSEKENNPGFLIHDSTIFDGVDERQVAHAIQLAEKEANKHNFQYICCLNSDLVPWDEFGESFNLRDYVRIELTDAREDGGILGIRF